MLRSCGFYDVLAIEVDQVWVDWFGVKTTKLGRLPFIDPVSFRLYVTYPQLHNIVTSQLRSLNSMGGDGFGLNGPPASHKTAPDLLTSTGATVYPENAQPVRDLGTSKFNNDPTMNVIFVPLKRVTVYLDHYQFLVLMRIQEMITQTLDFIDQDTKLIMGGSANEKVSGSTVPDDSNIPKELKVSVIGVLPFVDVALMLPAQPDPPELIAKTRSCLLSSYDKAESLSSKVELRIHEEGENVNNGCISSTQDSCDENDIIEDVANNNVLTEQKAIPVATIEANVSTSTTSPIDVIDDDEVGTLGLIPSVRIGPQEEEIGKIPNSSEKLTRSASSNRTMRSSSGVSSASTSSKVNLLTLTSPGSLSAKFSASFTNTTSAMGKSFTDAMSIAGSEISIGSGGYSSEDDFICLNADGPVNGSVPKASSYEDELKPVNTYKPEEEFLGEERKDANVGSFCHFFVFA